MKYPESRDYRKFNYFLILDHNQILSRYADQNIGNIIDHPDILVVPYELSTDLPLVNLLHAQGLFTKSRVIFKNPFFDDQYVMLGDALYTLAVDKGRLFAEFCSYLGARALAIRQLDISNSGDTFKLSVALNINDIEIGGGVNKVDTQILTHFTQTRYRYQGGKLDDARAEQLLHEHYLTYDNGMVSLLNQRRNTANSLINFEQTLYLSKEYSHMIKVMEDLHIAAYLSSITGQQVIGRNESRQYVLRIDVSF